MDVAVDPLWAEALDRSLTLQDGADPRLDPGQPQGHVGLAAQHQEVVDGCRPLRVQEVDALTVEHHAGGALVLDQDADPVRQGVGGREEQSAAEPEDDNARNMLRISGTFIIPITTASMINAPRTGFGSCEKSGARNSSVSRTVTPEVIDAKPVLAPEWSLSELAERLVETGIP